MNRRTSVVAAMSAVAVLAVPATITATTAAWNDAEWVHGEGIGTSVLECDTTTGFETTGYGRFLSGSLLGTDLDPIADLEQMTLALDGGGVLDVDPAGALNLGSPPPTYTYADPFDLSLLSIVGVDLTGLGVPLPGAALGAANQWAQVSAYGDAAGASGLINDSGIVTVGSFPPADLPDPATVSLSGLLPGIAGITDAQLEIGAIGASSQLDGCAALYSELWGDGSVTGVTRDYGIAGLGLEVDSPLIAGLLDTVETGVDTIDTAVGSLLGTDGAIADALLAEIGLDLGGVLTTTVTGDVTISGLDLDSAVSTLLNLQLTDGVVTIDLQNATIDVDLDALLPSLNGAAPNTELVLNSTVLNPIVTRVNTLLQNWIDDVIAALEDELGGATLTVGLDVDVNAPGIFPLPGLQVLDISLDLTGTVDDILSGGVGLSVDAEAAGAVGAINTLLAALGLPTVSDLISSVEGLTAILTAALVDTIEDVAFGAIDALDVTLGTLVPGILTALDGFVAALPTVLSLMVNVQPDQPGAPSDATFIPGTDTSTPQYVVSALRVGLADFLTPGDVAHVVLGTASAGPVSAP
jgi:hypothetical protein